MEAHEQADGFKGSLKSWAAIPPPRRTAAHNLPEVAKGLVSVRLN
jgi:hypothetical protein